MANVNANINVNIQTQQAAAQLRKLSADISRFNQQTFAANSAAAQQQRALNQALIDGVRTSGHFRTSIVPMTSAVENFSNSIEKGKLSLGQYTRYAASQLPGMRRVFTREFDMINRVAEMRVRKLNTQFVALGESANGMRTALAMTPTALDQFAARSAIALQRQQIFNRLLRDGSTQLLNWGKNTQWAGRQLMVGFTVPLGLLGAQAAKVFKELEAEAINFKKVYGDMFTTDVEVEKNLAAIKELSMEMTKYGQTAQQTMQLANTAAQSGARGAELMAATRQATRLAILGQMEQNQAIETTISLQTAFSLSNEQLAESINFLNSVENQTILSLQDVSEAIPRVASVIKGFGGDVEDLSVLLVAMKEGGVSAAEGANALKNSMARVIAPTKRALETSAKYGIALQDIVARNEGKVVPLFQELARALEAVGGQERQEILSDIFGKFQYARIGTLLSNIAKDGSQAAKAIELTGVEARDLAATAERELSAVEDAVGTKFTAALEKAKVALAPVGEEFLKALTPVLDVVGKILGKFDELPGGIKTAIVAATAIIGGIAPIVLMVTGLVANGIANIAKFILFLRKQIATLRGNGEQFKMYTSAELEAAAAAASLEGKTSSLTKTMLLQRPAIETLITLYNRLATSARTAAAAMPTTMGGVGVPFVGPRGGGFRSVAPPLPVAYRNTGGEIFESASGQTRVPGSGNTDTVPAMLTPGEFVINKKATKENLPLIQAINSGDFSLNQSNSLAGAPAEGIQRANIGLLLQGLRRVSAGVRPMAASGKVFPKWFYDTSTGTNRARQKSALEDSYKLGVRIQKQDGTPYTLREIQSMSSLEIKEIWKGVQRGHMAPSVPMGSGKDYLPGIVGPMSAGGKGGNLSIIRGGNPKEIYDMFSALEAKGIHPMSIMFGAAKDLGYKVSPSVFTKAYDDLMTSLLHRRIKFGSQESFEQWAYRILQRHLGKVQNDSGNFFERMKNVGTVRGIDPKRTKVGGKYVGGRGSLFAAMLPGFNTGGYVGSSSMYDPRYMRGSSGSQTVNRMNNYRQYVNARRNVKSTTSFSNRNRNLRRIRPPKPRTLLDYAIPRQSTFASVPVPMPHKERVRLPQPQDLTGRFVRDVPGTSVGSRYQYAAKPQTGIPFLDNLHERTGLKSYELVAAPPSVLRDKYGRSISREEYNKRERFRNVLRFESNQRIRQAMKQSEMARRENYRKGAAYRFGEEATRVKAPLYDGGKGVSSRLGQDRGRAELQRDRLLGIKPMMMKMPDTRDPREKVKSFKVRPGETIRLPNGEMYTNDSRSTKYITNPYYRKAPGSRWVNPQTMMPYDLGGQADVDLKNIFPTRRLAKSVEDANIPELARLGIPWAERMSQQVHRTGAFGVPGFNKGGMIPGVQYLWGGGIARYLMHPLRALRDRSASKAQIYFKGADMYPANMSDHRFQSTFIAYKKRKLLRDKAVGGITYQGSGGKYDVVPYNELFPGKMLVDPRGRGMPPTVQTMGVMPGYEYLAPQLLGLVGRQSLQRYGKMPLASSNLSVYSSKIVKLLVKRGIIKDPGFRDDFNEITRRGARGLIADMKNDLKMSHQSGIISKEEVSKSSRFVRSLLSSSRPKTQKEFEQLSLFKAPSPAPAKTSSPIIESIQKDFLRIINSPKGMQNSKEIGNLGSRLLRLQQTMGVTRESEELLLQIGRAFNRSKAMGLNKGGKVPKEFLKQSIKLNSGNTVPGVGNTDTVPAMLTPGEFVVNKQATQENLPLLHAINDGKTQFLQLGGQTSNPYKQGFLRQIRSMTNPRLRAAFERQYLLAAIGAEAGAKATGVTGYRMPAYGHFATVDKSLKENWRLGGRNAPGMPISPVENQLQESMKSSSRNRAMFEKYLRQELGGGSKAEKTTQKIMKKLEKNQMLSAKEQAIQAKVLKDRLIPAIERGEIIASDKGVKGKATVSPGLLGTAKGFVASYEARESARARIAAMSPEYRSRVVSRMLSMRAVSGVGSTVGIKPGQAIPRPQAYAPLPPKTFAQSTSPQALARQIKMQNPGMTSSQALAEARRQLGGAGGGGGRTPTFLGMPGMGDPNGPGIRPNQSMYARANAAVGRFGMGAGMGLSMAAMLPMMKQDEQGKFMGMDAGTAMMGLMGGGMLLSIAPMLGAAALPIIGLGAVAAGVGLGLKAWRNNVDETSKKTALLGANIGGTANALNTMAELFGEQTPAKRRAKAQLQFSEPEQEEAFGKFQNYLGSELGQKFIKDLENATSAQRFEKLSDYLRNAIAGGILTGEDAKLFAKTIASALGDPVLGQSVLSSIKGQLTGSRGMLEIARERDVAIQEDPTLQAIISQTEDQKIAYADAAKMAGASLQALQDFGNATALASEQYSSGRISFDQYKLILDETTTRQNAYADSLEKSIKNTTDFGGTMMAISDQLTLMGLEKEQVEILLKSGEVSLDVPEVQKSLKEQVDRQFEKEYGKLSYNEETGMAYSTEGIGNRRRIPAGAAPRLQIPITQLNMERVTLQQEMFEKAKERQPEILAASLDAVVSGLVTPAQAKSVSNLLAIDQDLYSIFSRLGGGAQGVLGAAFAQDTNVRQIEGLDEEGMRLYRDIGVNIIAEGYDLAAFQSFIEGLPQEKRINIVTNFTGMSDRAQQAIIATGAMGEQVQERLLSSNIYQSRMSLAREQKSTPYAGEVLAKENVAAQQAEKDIENINNAVNSIINSVGEGIAADIIFATNTISNGQEEDSGKWIRNLGKIERQVLNIQNKLPKEIYSQIEINFTSAEDIAEWSKMANVFEINLGTLQQLDPNVDIIASMRFLTLDSRGNELTPKQVADNVIELNSSWNDLRNSTKKEVRAKALLTIGTAMMFGQEGQGDKPMDEEAAKALVDEKIKKLAEETGGKVYNADPNIVMESIQIMFDMSQQRAQAAALEQSAAELGAVPGLEATASLAKEQAAALLADANRREQAAIEQVRTSGKQNAGGGGGGGGGGSQSPVQGFVEKILNQFKMWVDAGAKMADLNNARTKFVDMVLKGDSIFNRLNKVKGIDPMRLQEILGMGPEGAQEFLDKYAKGGKLTKAGKGILDAAAAAGINETIGMAAIQATQTRQQTRAANILSGRGAGSGLIQQIAGDPRRSAELVRLQKEYNQAVKSGNDKEIEKADKALNKYIRSQGRAIQAEKDREEATKSAAQKAIDSNNDIIEANNKAMEEGDYYFQKEESRIIRSYRDRIKSAEDQIDSINKQIDAVNKLIDEQEKLNRSDQNRIRGLERQKEMLNRQLEELDRANELDGRRIETLQREDEIRGRVEEALSRELELMSRAEEDIRDSYQKRIDALDEVAKVNDYILNQQRQQLDLSRAISEGDIYAATAAAQEMRASSAGFAVDQVRQGLETGMENQIAGLRTSEGLTRGQAEERIRQIQDQSYQTSLQIRDIEDAIYNRNLQMIPIKDQIRNYDLQIRDIQDTIYNRESEILRIQTEQLEPLQTSLTTQQDILDNLNDQVDAEIEAITYNGMNAMQWADNKELIMDQNRSLEKTNEILQEEDERLAGISKKWENISKQIRQANRIAKEKITDIEVKAAADIAQIKSNTDLSDDEINEAVRKRTAKRLEDVAAAEQERQKKADKLLESGSSLGAFAGGLMKYAMGGMINPSRFTSNEAPPIQRRSRGGSVFGSGSRDSIAAMLTPGEFVIRKAMVDKYGIPMMEALNQGSFSMPRYSMPENMGGTPVVSTSNMTSISAPVYNTYDMKFSINGANQSADEIANKVMFKMKQLQNQQIRGNRGY